MSASPHSEVSTAVGEPFLGFIYQVTNKVNLKKYVGQTTASVNHRWSQHIHSAKKGSTSPFHRALRKYGPDAFTVEVLEVVRGDRDLLLETEKEHIANQGCLVPRGYNLGAGGEGVDFSNPEVRSRHLQAVRQSSAKSSWREAQFEGARKRVQDPEWLKKTKLNLERLHSSPVWKERNQRMMQSLRTDPVLRGRQIEGVQRRSSDETWKANHKEAMQKMQADPAYQAKVSRARKQLAESQVAKALARDALLSPEEVEKRVRKRAQKRKRYHDRKSLV